MQIGFGNDIIKKKKNKKYFTPDVHYSYLENTRLRINIRPLVIDDVPVDRLLYPLQWRCRIYIYVYNIVYPPRADDVTRRCKLHLENINRM